MIIDTAQVILDLRFWIAETADGLRLTAYSLQTGYGAGSSER